LASAGSTVVLLSGGRFADATRAVVLATPVGGRAERLRPAAMGLVVFAVGVSGAVEAMFVFGDTFRGILDGLVSTRGFVSADRVPCGVRFAVEDFETARVLGFWCDRFGVPLFGVVLSFFLAAVCCSAAVGS